MWLNIGIGINQIVYSTGVLPFATGQWQLLTVVSWNSITTTWT